MKADFVQLRPAHHRRITINLEMLAAKLSLQTFDNLWKMTQSIRFLLSKSIQAAPQADVEKGDLHHLSTMTSHIEPQQNSSKTITQVATRTQNLENLKRPCKTTPTILSTA